ncbi:MAG: 16S rRNA (cytosine(1402)-N(4))-methyltransferase [Candidatus Wildermuthbacteria bacterium RIFCSPHIGHO2_02_FULL_47_12]|uniref:Ribosomal RNA small subunit methyltransferase H n=2 Tax=Parcubacteria group TaxID=1794811 RepID=A0A1G2R3P2_9BACT|nr:MAG: 16S rRNA (cytosine(1402)-N(4))-methyltransferase [Candidatus Buchananbacteria bacterium RIFCSPLOWO2_01_FULL_46_12]OHA67337.1 MAG: 16S rRNA (cytosine(1402)-N(4))-methyltransferase [Candidatus Wildermuthbacteria bacterium RIFCSPHIGHO2_02_FULL_47_12]
MHIPVLKDKVIEYLKPKPNEHFIDCTVGQGGHAMVILEKTGPRGKVLGIDQDSAFLSQLQKTLQKQYKSRLILAEGNFAHITTIAQQEKFKPVHGILFDLGFSSLHIEESRRGFSFQKQEPLDMRYSLNNPITAEKIVNYWSKTDIERILKEYGEEQFSKEIAQAIAEQRAKTPIVKTTQLVNIIESATPKWYHKKKAHPATKTFQALRIAVNAELENIKEALPQAIGLLEPAGRIAVISFHSLEDRIVKNFFKTHPLLNMITKKPITPSLQEQKANPRSRSAKLRVALKLPAKT